MVHFPKDMDLKKAGSCDTLCEMKLCEQFKQSAQALELLHERKMWNEQKPYHRNRFANPMIIIRLALQAFLSKVALQLPIRSIV